MKPITETATTKRIHADYRARLATENAHAETLRIRHAIITAALADRDARRAQIAARYQIALAKAARKRKRKSEPLTDLPLFKEIAA